MISNDLEKELLKQLVWLLTEKPNKPKKFMLIQRFALVSL